MKARGKKRFGLRPRSLLSVLFLLVALSLYQYFLQGEVSWHREAIDGFLGNERAGWRLASGKAGELGERKEGTSPEEFDLGGRVVGVLDGDSILVLDASGTEHTIRLFGIDAPEKGQPFADTARSHLRQLLSNQTVGVVRQDTDQFGRTVGSVYLGDRHINLELVLGGYAWWFRRYAPHDRLLQEAEQQARGKGIGLWALPDPVAPWQWRRQFRSAALWTVLLPAKSTQLSLC